MSDDLTVAGVDGICRSYDEHYDTMKEVVANPYGAWDAIQKQAARIEELEAKLDSALLALERIASGEFSGRMLTSMPPQDAAAYFARTTLAELKGEDRG